MEVEVWKNVLGLETNLGEWIWEKIDSTSLSRFVVEGVKDNWDGIAYWLVRHAWFWTEVHVLWKRLFFGDSGQNQRARERLCGSWEMEVEAFSKLGNTNIVEWKGDRQGLRHDVRMLLEVLAHGVSIGRALEVYVDVGVADLYEFVGVAVVASLWGSWIYGMKEDSVRLEELTISGIRKHVGMAIASPTQYLAHLGSMSVKKTV